MTAITEPGVYDIPADVYHDDPVPGGSLSSSGARKLLPPHCPAKFRHEQIHGQPHNQAFDFGHAAHLLVLGSGPDLAVIDADNYRTKAAQQARDEAYAAGQLPLLTGEYEQVQEMAAALRAHPIASTLFNPDRGRPEQSLFWRHGDVWRRARLDWLPNPGSGRMIVPDYKTTASEGLDGIDRAIHTYGYHIQAAWYLDAVRALKLGDEHAAMVFVFQEKTPPYLVTVVQPDAVALHWGAALIERALAIYQHCTTTDHWPGYTDKVLLSSLPAWAEKQYENAFARGDYDMETTR